MKFFTGIVLLASMLVLQSCEFSCSVGDKGEKNKKAVRDPKSGARILNEIKLESTDLKIEKAYLVFADGEMVPDDNIVDFSQTIKLIIVFESGWKEMEGKVHLGASEKIVVQGGEVLLDEADLFAEKLPNGMSAEDAKVISLSATINAKKEIKPLTAFTVSFRVWDKNSNAAVQGEYKLYAK
ncbi:hypothetical protein CAP36_17470 [Chitinophagaceae bacterium IBVUCB2]|nr:hypothetical protein CAP36_17470 [Chitinophagaceae bacterium IBVUCB2]